jgi:hypothetical protein
MGPNPSGFPPRAIGALADNGTPAGRYQVLELKPPQLPQFVNFFELLMN